MAQYELKNHQSVNLFPQFQDSLLDLIVSLGVPLDHLVLGVPSVSSKFHLEDPSHNTPRSDAQGPPERLSYKQVSRLTQSVNFFYFDFKHFRFWNKNK